ncbi:MAG: tyrosine protein kinase [Flavobacteriaceae bacterium]|nr:tyrosine protein kinase [Flavobacteriaceae bacterium]|tara:strand:+ start:26924 stop:29320 length:2397 start_codon:yes stop_codon:yes gene_type:complete
MNQSPNFDYNHFESDDNFDFKKVIFRYLYFWKYFVATSLLFIVIAFLYLRYTPKIYNATAKIKILDKKESTLELPTVNDLFSNSSINLENEIAVIKSRPIISQVVENKNLHTSVFSIGDIMESLTIDYPFEIMLKIPVDSLSNSSYRLNITSEGFDIVDNSNDSKKYFFKGVSSYNFKHDLPFEIFNFDSEKFINKKNKGYEIHITSVDKVISSLKKSIKVSQVGKKSDIIQIEFKSRISDYSEIILDELINVFNNDGIHDRQLIHKRTIDFVNERYGYLSIELDSIEITKQLYKADNDLVDLSANSAISLEQSYKSQENIFSIENQISLTNLLIITLDDSELELLPANIGIENGEINLLILDYNSNILERKKLILSAGQNNPSIKQLDNVLSDGRSNIIFSLRNYLNQLESTKQKLSRQSAKFDVQVSNLPEKEKILRAIERNQQIKEALYLFLLQKREESEVSYAVTEPSIKVVEYALSNNIPVSPNSNIIYLGALLLGLLLPFGVLYLMFMFNTKLYSKDDLEELNLNAPLIAEIPEIYDTYKLIQSAHERSTLAESFRILSSNLNFIIPKNIEGGKVIISTSTIKGEGKTFTALNLALAYSSLNKKVLLIGADLHNPQIHKYLNLEKSISGLTNYLLDNNFNWKSSLVKANSDLTCDIMLGGVIPPNPAQLLTNGNLNKLIDEAKAIYDYIIIDTPPALLVSDTLSIVHLSDAALFVARCNHTDRGVLNFIKDSIDSGKVKNVGLVLNGLGATNSYGYGYAYNYSYKYGYGYKYAYNYGYGYGYESDDDDNPSS